MASGEGALMGTAVDYAQRAAECRRLGTQHTKPEHWEHFLEMAETWEMLLRHQQERSRWQTIALADRFRNVLFLSDKRSAEESNNEKAA
jgi:hypothetical protein